MLLLVKTRIVWALFGFALLFAAPAAGQSKSKTQLKTKTASAKPAVQPLPSPPEEENTAQQVVTAEPGKDVVAVYYFTTSRDYSYDYAVSVGNAVEAGFVRSSRFTVVERNRFGNMKEEDKFKEANTSELINKASRFGAKTIVTGHIVGVSQGELVDSYKRPTGKRYAEISLSFKIMDVESGQIKMSEIIRGRGEGSTTAEALQNSYISIDKMVRSYIGTYLPQRFKFMEITEKGVRKKAEYLDKFKVWGGSDDGLKVGDVVELYTVSYLTNPVTNKKVEEKKLLGQANVIEINSGSTATCKVINGSKLGSDLLNMVAAQPNDIVIEYKGNWYVKPKSLLDLLTN